MISSRKISTGGCAGNRGAPCTVGCLTYGGFSYSKIDEYWEPFINAHTDFECLDNEVFRRLDNLRYTFAPITPLPSLPCRRQAGFHWVIQTVPFRRRRYAQAQRISLYGGIDRVIPAAEVARVRDQLDLFRIDERLIFPDLDGVAAIIRRYYSGRQGVYSFFAT